MSENNMTVLWNKMTGEDHLTNKCNWESLIDNHYEKFKFFYKMLKYIKIEKIDIIACSDNDSSLIITMEFSTDKKAEKHLSLLQDAQEKVEFSYKKYFTFDYDLLEKLIHIEISNQDIKEEGDIYENILNSNG
jgi:hypothetical protein